MHDTSLRSERRDRQFGLEMRLPTRTGEKHVLVPSGNPPGAGLELEAARRDHTPRRRLLRDMPPLAGRMKRPRARDFLLEPRIQFGYDNLFNLHKSHDATAR